MNNKSIDKNIISIEGNLYTCKCVECNVIFANRWVAYHWCLNCFHKWEKDKNVFRKKEEDYMFLSSDDD